MSLRAETPVGPWAFSLWAAAYDRPGVEQAALSWAAALLATGSTVRIARVMKNGPDYWSHKPGEVYAARAAAGDTVGN